MKKTIFAAIAATVALFATSCSKDQTTIAPADGQNTIAITFSQEGEGGTRAFFDATATAEPWEKKLNTMSVFVFDKTDGSLVVRRNMNAAELAAGKINFALPWTILTNKAIFYAVGNFTVPDNVNTQAGLQALLDGAPSDYNGTMTEILDKAKRAGGFVMSANKEVQLIEGVNNVALVLKRTVAKMAIRVAPSADFSERFMGAKIKVVRTEFVKVAKQTPVIAPATPIASALDLTLSQVTKATGEVYDNLYYLFENGSRAAADQVALKVVAMYDPDGNFGTAGDQIEMVYNVPFSDNGGAIRRNGYYRINLTITGLTGLDCTADITVGDWETPVSQDINLGK